MKTKLIIIFLLAFTMQVKSQNKQQKWTAANSINSAGNPFDTDVDTETNPERAFDPSYVYTSNQGIRAFAGLRFTLF